MIRRKGELSRATIDRDWAYQIALPADQCTGTQYAVKHDFCRGLSLCPRGHYFRRDDRDYVVFCFAEPSHADLFCERFDGEHVSAGTARRRW